jgi:hypothetical protein
MTLLQVTVTTDDLRKVGVWVLKGAGFTIKAMFDFFVFLLVAGAVLSIFAHFGGQDCASTGFGDWIKITTCVR